MALPTDYLERVYAGVLGKLIGVYLGRPFEGWSHARIQQTFGDITGYVHDQLNLPLVVTDDDVAGTFTFIRALEDHGLSYDLKSQDVGKTWLNYIVEGRSILWWGGNGISTEHTAWLNLKRGLPAPQSGSMAVNGRALSEQIGAQIFIDGWALVCPGQPRRAAAFAQQAGRVSHDGESVHAAMLWAAMEAQAFVSDSVHDLLEVGLGVIPSTSGIALLANQVRAWCETDQDWRETRRRIEAEHGYWAYPGLCHVVPNHALMLMALLYAPDDFQQAQTIINTAGWDTDCNAGNLGCLLGIKLGLKGLDRVPHLRLPLADRMLVSNADGGEAVTDAVRTAYRLAGIGQGLRGEDVVVPPKGGARFHFTLSGSVQGFRRSDAGGLQNLEFEGGRALALDLARSEPISVMTPTFAPPDVVRMPVYDLLSSPLVYPGQTLRARVAADPMNRNSVRVSLRICIYDQNDQLYPVLGPAHVLTPGASTEFSWNIPDLEACPVAEVGIQVEGDEGRVILDWLTWDGCPKFQFGPGLPGGDFWRRAWVNGATRLTTRPAGVFRVSQDQGEGLVLQGSRDWSDYEVRAQVKVHLARHAGVVARARGLRRHYAARLTRQGQFQIVKVFDDLETVLAEQPADFCLDRSLTFSLSVSGRDLLATCDGLVLNACDLEENAILSGSAGLVIADGALSMEGFSLGPCL